MFSVDLQMSTESAPEYSQLSWAAVMVDPSFSATTLMVPKCHWRSKPESMAAKVDRAKCRRINECQLNCGVFIYKGCAEQLLQTAGYT